MKVSSWYDFTTALIGVVTLVVNYNQIPLLVAGILGWVCGLLLAKSIESEHEA